MKIRVMTALAGLIVSCSALANTPANYDTKFNVSANVPDGAMITDPSGNPVTSIDVELLPVGSGKMEATTEMLKLWNNDIKQLAVSLTMDDSQVATGSPFTLYNTDRGKLVPLSYSISAITNAAAQVFTNSGDSKDFNLVANGAANAELPVKFKFVSNAEYKTLAQGKYTGVVYANLVAKS